MADLQRLLERTRLLTLTGAGGVGKTRLALETAAQVLPRFPNGVWLVELAPVNDESLIPNVVCLALGVKTQPGRSALDTLIAALEPATTLLILDNCEHLLGACATFVLRLLRACPALRVLATSREALGVVGEISWLVPPLAPVNAEALFVERATAANRLQTWGESTRAAARVVCARLDGVPLALELAAAWTRALTVADIAVRLADAAPTLLAAPNAATERQRTLRATVGWSLALLPEEERVLFERLSVFTGGFSLDAAQAISDGDVLTALGRLVSASLVVHEDGRYRLLEPTRQVGLHLLGDRVADIRRRHADYFVGLVESVQGSLWGRSARGGGIGRLEQDVDNLRAALRWSIDQCDAELAGRLGAGLARFWLFSERVGEGRRWLDALLELSELSTRTRARLLVAAGAAATYELDLVVARQLLEAGEAAAREAGDDWSVAWAVFLFAWAAPPRSDHLQFERLLELCAEGAARSRASGDPVLALMHELTTAILLALSGRAEAGEEVARRGLRRVDEAGAPRELARAWMALGIALYVRGDLPAAGQALERSRLAWVAEGEALEVPTFAVVTGLLLVAADSGEPAKARAHLRDLLDLWSKHGRLPQLAGACLGAFAYLSAAEHKPDRVVRACAVLATGGRSLDVLRFFGRSLDAVLASARQELGQGEAEAAWAAGTALSLEQACAEALAS